MQSICAFAGSNEPVSQGFLAPLEMTRWLAGKSLNFMNKGYTYYDTLESNFAV